MLSIIVAVSENGIIGCNNTLIWNLKDDLKRFKEITSNHTIIVGRKTFEALPFVLPNRKHIVITNNENYTFMHEDVKISRNLEEILNFYKNLEEEIFIIGGGEIYKNSLDYVDKIYLTKIFYDFSDLKNEKNYTYFNFDESNFNITYKSEIIINDSIPFQYINYHKKTKWILLHKKHLATITIRGDFNFKFSPYCFKLLHN